MGISGDMTLGALIDAGVDAEAIRIGINSLKLPDVQLKTEQVIKGGFRATYVTVEHPEQHAHRHCVGQRLRQRENEEPTDFGWRNRGAYEQLHHGSDLIQEQNESEQDRADQRADQNLAKDVAKEDVHLKSMDALNCSELVKCEPDGA